MDKGAESYQRYLNGDDGGFYEIVREYFDGLTAYLTGVIGNKSDAEEAADDALYKLAVKKPRYNGKSSFKTWLYAIGRNVAIDAKRKKRPEQPLDDAAVPDQISAEDQYVKDEQKRILYEAMNCLKPEYREVLWLLYFEGMSADEAANVLKKSKGGVYTLVSRAKSSLKEKLQERGFNYEIL